MSKDRHFTMLKQLSIAKGPLMELAMIQLRTLCYKKLLRIFSLFL